MVKIIKPRRGGELNACVRSLESNLKAGLNCTVVTMNPEKIKEAFERITGLKLNLEKDENGNYKASLKG